MSMSNINTNNNNDNPQQHVVNNNDNPQQHVVNNNDNPQQHVVNNNDNPQQHVVNNNDNPQQHVVNNNDNPQQYVVNNNDNPQQHVVNNNDNPQQYVVNNNDNPQQHVVNNNDNPQQHGANHIEVPDEPPLGINFIGYEKFIIVIIIAILFYYWRSSSPATCDMKIAENRNFNRYYGIIGLTNHFTTPAADECDSNIIFTPALPQSILKSDNSASSFLTLAKYGTGKTLLRCEYSKSLQSDKYFIISMFNKQISEFVERFVRKTSDNENNCENRHCLYGWTENEFAQLILSTLITQFITLLQKQNIKFEDTSIEEKIQLITIICYYYDGFGTSELEYFINNFLKKSKNEFYEAQKVVVQIHERNRAQDEPLLIHFKQDLAKFSVLKQDYERLHLLLAVIEGEQFQHKAIVTHMYGNVFNDLTHFSKYIKKHLNKIPVFIIDGIDENQYFFQNNAVNKASMESFCHSSVSQKILSKVMANDYYLSIFYPEIDGINIEDAIVRKDKFPIHVITWNSKSLINYADYVLQQMNQYASSSRCKSFTDFKTLVNYSNKRSAEIINSIPTPRSLHYFMTELITEMNNDANDVSEPFKATFDNVRDAYGKASQRHHKIHREIMEERTFVYI